MKYFSPRSSISLKNLSELRNGTARSESKSESVSGVAETSQEKSNSISDNTKIDAANLKSENMNNNDVVYRNRNNKEKKKPEKKDSKIVKFFDKRLSKNVEDDETNSRKSKLKKHKDKKSCVIQ